MPISKENILLELENRKNPEELFDTIYKDYFSDSECTELQNIPKHELWDVFQPQAIINQIDNALDLLGRHSIVFLEEQHRETIRSYYLSLGNAKKGTPFETLQEACHISDERVEEVYKLGELFYRENRYADAEALFYLLILFSPFHANLWFAYGLCQQAQGKFKRAIDSYAYAILADPELVGPYLATIECCLKEKEIDKAKETIALVESMINKTQDSSYRERLQALKIHIK